MPEPFGEGRAEAPEVDGVSRAALEESYLDSRLLFEANAGGMLLVSFDANPGAWTREQVISAGLDGLLDPSDARLETVREVQRKTGRFKGALRLWSLASSRNLRSSGGSGIRGGKNRP